ncbi:MAG: hypothetical protein V4805_03640 [Pseudomonadota bacterium]
MVLADYRQVENFNGAEVNRAVPGLINTGDTSPERIGESSASGFTLLRKPINPKQLLQLLQQA